MKLERVLNENQTSCDNCENHPRELIVIQGDTALESECLSICGRCFRSLKKLIREFK